MRGAARLAPQQAAASTAAFLDRALLACGAAAAAAAAAAGGGDAAAAGGAGAVGGAALTAQRVQLEAAVQLLEAALPALVGGEGAGVPPGGTGAGAVAPGAPPAAGGSPAVVEALRGMLARLLALRLRDPVLVTLHARALEAFSRFAAVHGDAIVPLVQASLECLQAVPLEQNGQLPPPARVSQRWKEEAVARTAMAKVLLHVAREAPGALLPHLQPLAARAQELWDQGRLREGERVSLYEGLMAAAAWGGAELQGQLLEWLLRPVHAKWTAPAWQAAVASPAAFAAEYMPFEQAAPAAPGAGAGGAGGGAGGVVIGSAAQRWALHYELQLFERALRHTAGGPAGAAAAAAAAATAAAAGGAAGAAAAGTAAAAAAAAGGGPASPLRPAGQQQQGQQGQQQGQHPFAPHLEWSLTAICQVVRCLHGLQAPAMLAGPLAPLAPAFEMDAVERALRSGGEREAAKRAEEDAGTIAGPNHAALRYWMRSIREGAYMVLAYAAAGAGAPLWLNPRLAAAVPSALVADVEHMDDRHARILLRHAVGPLVAHCPVGVRPPWLVPLFAPLLPDMHRRLTGGWARVAAAGGSAADGAAAAAALQQQLGGAPAAAAAGGAGLEDEVVAESVLRDLSREYVALLAKVAERGGGGSGSGGAGGARTGGSGSPGGAAADGGAAAGAGAAGAAAGGAAAAGAAGGEESVLESVWRYDSKSVAAAAATAVAALCWPDALAAGKACAACRALASLAETTHPELENLVVADMLRSAVLSTVQVSHITIQAEVLGVIRQLLVTWLPRGSPAVRGVLLQLPHVTPAVLAAFQGQLLATGSEKEQRGVVKRLLAESGGDAARAVLSAVSRVPVNNVPEPAGARRGAGGAPARPEDEIRWDWGSAGVAI